MSLKLMPIRLRRRRDRHRRAAAPNEGFDVGVGLDALRREWVSRAGVDRLGAEHAILLPADAGKAVPQLQVVGRAGVEQRHDRACRRHHAEQRQAGGEVRGAVDRIDDEGKVGPEAELVELIWVPLDGIKQQIELMVITELALLDLQKQIEAGFSHDLPVPFYHVKHGRRLRDML